MPAEVVKMRGICKAFGSVRANDKVDLDIFKGEILTLLGENGAGKTTLMNVLYGLYQADSGSIAINGIPVHISSPLVATDLGISMVHQHFMLVNSMSVAENVVLGVEPRKGIFFDRAKSFEEITRLSQLYGLKVNAHDVVSKLPVGMKQRVEILKALYRQSDILIFDEPTAVLTPQEVNDFFGVLKSFKEAGKSIVLITHKLKEAIEVSDRIAIMRQGRMVDTLEKPFADINTLAELMVGRRIMFSIDRKLMPEELPVLMSLRQGTLKQDGVTRLADINLDLHGGEIHGIAGVDGNGQTELAEVLTGLCRLTSGEILIEGQVIKSPTPAKMLASRLGHIPEDRSTRGIISRFSVSENLILGYQTNKGFSGKVQLKHKKIEAFATETVKRYDIKCDKISDPIRTLSGGNQQKVVIGRVMSEDPLIVIAAQPTRGVDIGAIEYIHERIMELRDSGKAILLISADLDEVIKLSDRVSVMYGGRLVSTDLVANYDERRLGALMAGQTEESLLEEAQ